MNATVCAVSTAEGEGGIAIVRLSGEHSLEILSRCFAPAHGGILPRKLSYGHAVDASGSFIDEVMAVFLPGPASYTREDMAEVHCHGGRVCARRVISRMTELGAIPAPPGEFTKRAFLNGRIDLTRAEAVMSLIGAGGEAAARASLRQLDGGVSGFIRRCAGDIRELLSAIGAGIDFPEEVDESETARDISAVCRRIVSDIDASISDRGAKLLREGASIVLTGRPNVGKSSLMNALLKQDRAIVTSIPGTTRDVLTERITLGGVLCELSDTAGLRETSDVIEKMGVDRAEKALKAADIILKLYEPGDEVEASWDEREIVVVNKVDIAGEGVTPSVGCADSSPRGSLLGNAAFGDNATSFPLFRVSALTGEGLPDLVAELEDRVKESAAAGESGMTVERHIRLAREAQESLMRAARAAEEGLPPDMAEIDLKAALEALLSITGENATEEVIDGIFSGFCVGK